MPSTQLNVVGQLAAFTGAEHVRANEDSVIVSPADTLQVSEILRYANENALTVTPIGGGTKQSWGNPTRTDIHLSLSRLNRVLEHPWQDLTCTVQAGCTWQHLQESLKQHGQFVALDPLWPERATVGGVLATNDSGALRHRYGSLRDLVIGMTLVLADGTVARSGGRVVKNVAGYDLCKLLTGSFGTLAIITEATFRLHPLPQHAQTFTVSAAQAQQLAPLMASIRASHLLTQALQLRGAANGFHLDIRLNAHPEAKQDDILQMMVEAAGHKLEPTSESIWSAREGLFDSNNALILKITMNPTEASVVAEQIATLGGRFVVQALGIMYASFPDMHRDLSQMTGSIYANTKVGSAVVIRHSASRLPDLTPPWDKRDPISLMQAVKHQFDPNRTLNPSRFLGRI